jgi:hypothetical protein
MTRGSNFGGQAWQVILVLCSAPNPTSAAAGNSPSGRRYDGSSAMTVAGALSSRWPTKTFGQHGPLGHLGRLGKTSRFLLAAAADAASRRRPILTSPPASGILAPYLRCETGQQPYGRRRIIRFRCRGPAASLSPAETSFASGFLPSTTTDFLAPRGNCVHHADPVSQSLTQQRRGRISVSYQTDSRVPRTLAITPSRPSFCFECGRGTQSCSAHAMRGVNVRTTRTEKKE